MEQFENPQPQKPPVKEKSIYLLHLDGARILILSAITIGLLTVAFLIGMKISNDGENQQSLVQNEALIDQTVGIPLDPNATDPSQGILPDAATAAPAQNAISPNQQPALPDLSSAKGNTPAASPASDIMTAEENHVVIPPAKEVAKSEPKSLKKKAAKKEIASKKKKDTVVEVFSDVRPAKKNRTGFVLQVASFDKVDVAKRESEKLKSYHYDSFVDKTILKGKSFYRVRIGPIASKEKALQMLDDLQSNDRYAESYVTKE